MNEKKGFLVYFDKFHALMGLPPEQVGMVLSVMCEYADLVWRDLSVTLESVVERHPELSSKAQLACSFMGADILRDTKRWLSQQQSRAQRRQAQGQGRGEVPSPQAESREAEKAREDMERMRRLLDHMKEGE